MFKALLAPYMLECTHKRTSPYYRVSSATWQRVVRVSKRQTEGKTEGKKSSRQADTPRKTQTERELEM